MGILLEPRLFNPVWQASNNNDSNTNDNNNSNIDNNDNCILSLSLYLSLSLHIYIYIYIHTYYNTCMCIHRGGRAVHADPGGTPQGHRDEQANQQ